MPRLHLDLLQGTLDMLILQTLSHGPRHGYGIASFIGDSSKGMFRILDGAWYAALHRLERSGLVAAAWGVSDRGRRARGVPPLASVQQRRRQRYGSHHQVVSHGSGRGQRDRRRLAPGRTVRIHRGLAEAPPRPPRAAVRWSAG
jgi:hypothetical protein